MIDPIQDLVIDGVLHIRGPRTAGIPMVFDSPHSGLTIPADFHPAVSAERILVSADTYVDDLFSVAPDLGAPLLSALFPRSFLDVNRSLLDMDVSMIEGAWPHPVGRSPTAERGMGLMWRYAWGNEPMHARKLTVTEAEDRIRRYWQPYHRELGLLLQAVYGRFGKVYHLNCHSMTAEGHAISSDGAGTQRADICLGDLHGTSASAEFTTLIRQTLEADGLTVAMNKPFRGAELTQAWSSPQHGRHSVQFEINRRLYMDEATRERNAGYAALKQTIDRLCRTLAGYASAQVGS